jgi:hypothetical protein
MKRTSSTSALLATLALMAALAVGLTSSATAGTAAHAGKHTTKPKAISCKSLIAPSLLIHDVAVDTGIAPEVDPATEVNPHYDKRGAFRGIPLRMCALYWTHDGYGNGTAYGNCNGCGTAPIVWYAGTGVTTQQFNRIYAHESVNGGLMPLIGPPFSKQRIPSLGAGSRAFMATTGLKSSDSNPLYQSIYGLYVLSKGKHGKPGNLLVLYAWPLSLQREEQIVMDLLRHNRF